MPAQINLQTSTTIPPTEAQERLAELTTLNSISLALTSTLDIQEILTLITNHTASLLRVEASSIALIEEEQGNRELSIVFAAASGVGAENVLNKRIAPGIGIVGWVAQHGKPVLIEDVTTDKRHFSKFDKRGGFITRSMLCVPLISKGIIIGAIQVMNKVFGQQLDKEDQRRLTSIAAPAATAIENARLYKYAQQEIIERVKIETILQNERVKLEERVKERTRELIKANKELEKASNMKDEFLASMSHELRTPLNTILGNADAVQGGIYGDMIPATHRSLEMIKESGQHLLALINDILDISKIEAGKVQLDFSPTSISTIAESSLHFIAQEALKKGIKVQTQFEKDLGIIVADGRRLKQVLINLLSNAVKFTPKGGEIGLKITKDTANNQMEFVVWDTGIGISGENLETIFEPFIQVDSKLSRRYAGTGLGLVLAHRMVGLHHGTLQVESTIGVGSKFTIKIPINPPHLKKNGEPKNQSPS